MNLNQLRKGGFDDYKTNVLGLTGDSVPSKSSKDSSALEKELRSILDLDGGDASSEGPGSPFPQVNEGQSPPANNKPKQNGGSRMEALLLKELDQVNDYLKATKDSLRLRPDVVNALAIDGFRTGFNYLEKISANAGNLSAGGNTGFGSAGTFSSLLGISEADIVMGILDWTIQRAKDELMHAFLGRWLEELQNDEILKLLFPNTLNILSTSDVTTVFSNGAVWKAAFKQDLDATPEKLPEVVKFIIDHLPAGRVSARTAKEIEGGSRIAVSIFRNIGSGSTLENSLVNVGVQASTVPSSQRSMLEKGAILSSSLLEGMTVVEQNRSKILDPKAFSQLTTDQLQDLWNTLYLKLKPVFDDVFPDPGSGAKDSYWLYNKVFDGMAKFRVVMTQMSLTFNAIKNLTSTGQPAGAAPASKKLDAQEVERYFQLSLDVVDQGITLLSLVKAIPASDSALYFAKVRPIVEDVMTGIQAVETQEYGQLITSLLDIVSTLNLVDAKQEQAIAQSVKLVKTLKMDLSELKGSEDSTRIIILKKAATDLKNLTKDLGGALPDSIRLEVVKVVALLEKAVTQTASDAKKLVDEGLDRLKLAIEKYAKQSPVGEKLNVYCRLVVDLLLADSSEDVEAIIDNFAAGESAYLVKQTSRSAFTATFLPGIGAGVEFLDNAKSGVSWNAPGMYFGASLPIGVEYSWGIRNCKFLGAFGVYGQAADLGALLNYRLTNTDTTAASPEIGFRQVFSPGLSLQFHFTKIPVVFGLGGAFSSRLRGVNPDTGPNFRSPSFRIGATLGVDVTAFQFWASKRKINPDYLRLGKQPASSQSSK